MSGTGSVTRDKRRGETDDEWKARGGTWKSSVRVPCPAGCDPGCGRRHQRLKRGFASKRQAQDELTSHLESVATQRYASPSQLSVEAYLEAWLDGLPVRVLSPTTLRGYRTNVERAYPYIGAIALQKLTATDLEQMYGRLRIGGFRHGRVKHGERLPVKGLSYSTIRSTHVALGIAFAAAARKGLVVRNVVPDADHPSTEAAKPERRPVWSLDEMLAFFDEIEGNDHEPFIRLAAMTGMRRSELCGLRWVDVDLDAATVRVEQTTLVVRSELVDWKPKSKNSSRVFLIDPATVEMLRCHRVRQIEQRLRSGDGTPGHDRVFVGPTGGITKPDTLTQAFTRLMSRSPLPRITLHGLRHSHATQMARLSTNKVEFKAVSRRLGHATEAFTLATYVDVELDDQAGPLGRLAAQMAK